MKKVFIASRFGEFKEIREKLTKELKEIGIIPINLDDNIALSQSPLERSLENVRNCDLMILLLGDTYGTIPNGRDKSFTHLEYQEAKEYNKLVFVFGIGTLYENNDIQYSNNKNMRKWQQEIENNTVLSKLDHFQSIDKLAFEILFNIYTEVNKIWFDEDTGLIWQVKIDSTEEHGRLPWKDIFSYRDNKNRECYGGFTDWRVPTIDELKTIYTDEAIFNPLNYDKATFIKKPLLYSMRMEWGRFWSETSNERNYDFAYGINFNRMRSSSKSKNGNKEKTAIRYVRCVRGWLNSIIVPKWEQVKNSSSIEEFQEFKIKFPNSKYETLINDKIDEIKIIENEKLNSLPPYERFLSLFKQEKTSESKELFLLKKIKEIDNKLEKWELLNKLKANMINEKKWKDPENAKDPSKARKQTKYKITVEIIELLKNCKSK